MGILGASTALTRYRIVDPVPDVLLQQAPQKLKEFAFKDIDATADERSFGWTNFDDMLDVTWSVSSPEKGALFCFTLRLETRRVAPAVLKKHAEIALRQEARQAKEQGRDFVSRARKKEIKEQVMLRLRARSLPVPAVFDCIWDHGANRLYLGTANSKARLLFEDLFQMTFELRLEPLAPFFLALDMLGPDQAKRLEDLEPTAFV